MSSLLHFIQLLITGSIALTFLGCSEPTGSSMDEESKNESMTKDTTASDQMPQDSERPTSLYHPHTEGDIPLDRLLGKFDPAKETDFVKIPEKYASRAGMLIRTEVWDAFLLMHAAAAADGIDLKILSATRNFDQQKSIWERKFGDKMSRMSMIPTREDQIRFAKEVLMFSSMPGTSRHHWGSDIDLNSLDPAYFDTPQGRKEYSWLVANAPKYGFCQPYTNKEHGRTGYEEEKWHWSFLPIAVPYLKEYQEKVTYDMVCCFWGSDLPEELEVIRFYVLGIEDNCKTLSN